MGLSLNTLNRWPMPYYDDDDQPHFLFIITPPNSGSTAISQLLNTSHRTMLLNPRGEGQWLVPGLYDQSRWDPNKKVNYRSVKATWLNMYQQVKSLTRNVDVVIEKSPPNMVRMLKLSSQFRKCSFIANNRNPFACCASKFFRANKNAELMSNFERRMILERLTMQWLARSRIIKELIADIDAPLLTYEAFCKDPGSVLRILKCPALVDTIDPAASVKVKDYKEQPIVNQNNRQISLLREEDISFISQLLEPEYDLLKYFGYDT